MHKLVQPSCRELVVQLFGREPRRQAATCNGVPFGTARSTFCGTGGGAGAFSAGAGLRAVPGDSCGMAGSCAYAVMKAKVSRTMQSRRSDIWPPSRIGEEVTPTKCLKIGMRLRFAVNL